MNLPGLGPVMSVEELNQRVRTVATDLATTPAAAEESFAEKISRAVKKKPLVAPTHVSKPKNALNRNAVVTAAAVCCGVNAQSK